MNTTKICPGVIHIEESYRVYCTLVQGAALSLLIDTGLGKHSLKPYAEANTASPYIVLNTHGHPDHVGGNQFFDGAFLAREDWPLAGPDAGRLSDLVSGTVFGLGDDTARIVPLAGHTAGSRGILLEKRRLLIAGDALNPRLLLPDADARTLDILRQTLETTLELPFDAYLTSHAPTLFGKAQLEAHLKHLDAFDPSGLAETRSMGKAAYLSRFKTGALSSEFVLGGAQPAM